MSKVQQLLTMDEIEAGNIEQMWLDAVATKLDLKGKPGSEVTQDRLLDANVTTLWYKNQPVAIAVRQRNDWNWTALTMAEVEPMKAELYPSGPSAKRDEILPVPSQGTKDWVLATANDPSILRAFDQALITRGSVVTRDQRAMIVFDLCRAIAAGHLPSARERPIVSVKPMALSGGRMDYYVSIQVGGREVTPHVFREEYKAAYHVALYDWLLNGSGEEPDCVDFGPDDWPARSGPPAGEISHGGRERCLEIQRAWTKEPTCSWPTCGCDKVDGPTTATEPSGRIELIEAEAKRRCIAAGYSLDRLACQDRRFRHDDRRPWWEAEYVTAIRREIEDVEKAGFTVSPVVQSSAVAANAAIPASGIMAAAEKAEKRVEGWSAAKKEYAGRVVGRRAEDLPGDPGEVVADHGAKNSEPACLQVLLEIRDFLQDLIGGADITERSRGMATGFVSIMDAEFGGAWRGVGGVRLTSPAAIADWLEAQYPENANTNAFSAAIRSLSQRPSTKCASVSAVGECVVAADRAWGGNRLRIEFVDHLAAALLRQFDVRIR